MVHPLHAYRLDHGLTQAALAVRLGVSKYSVSRLENGKQTPSFPLAVRIREATGIDLLELYRLADPAV